MKKATKIIGVVLGVLLVAALFTGTAAALDNHYAEVYVNPESAELTAGDPQSYVTYTVVLYDYWWRDSWSKWYESGGHRIQYTISATNTGTGSVLQNVTGYLTDIDSGRGMSIGGSNYYGLSGKITLYGNQEEIVGVGTTNLTIDLLSDDGERAVTVSSRSNVPDSSHTGPIPLKVKGTINLSTDTPEVKKGEKALIYVTAVPAKSISTLTLTDTPATGVTAFSSLTVQDLEDGSGYVLIENIADNQVGTHSISVTGVTSDNYKITGSPLTITVKEAPQPPTVTITAPNNGITVGKKSEKFTVQIGDTNTGADGWKNKPVTVSMKNSNYLSSDITSVTVDLDATSKGEFELYPSNTSLFTRVDNAVPLVVTVTKTETDADGKTTTTSLVGNVVVKVTGTITLEANYDANKNPAEVGDWVIITVTTVPALPNGQVVRLTDGITETAAMKKVEFGDVRDWQDGVGYASAVMTEEHVKDDDTAHSITAQAMKPKDDGSLEVDTLYAASAAVTFKVEPAKQTSFTAYVPYKNPKTTDGTTLTGGKTWFLLDNTGYPDTTTYITTDSCDRGVYFKGIVVEGNYVEEGSYDLSSGTTNPAHFGKLAFVTKPTIFASAKVVNANNPSYSTDLSGATVPKDSGYYIAVYNVRPEDAANAGMIEWQLVGENGAATKLTPLDISGMEMEILKEHPDAVFFTINDYKSGEYALQPYFKKGYLVDAPAGVEYGDEIPFTIIGTDDESIELQDESVTVGERFVATITGLPGVTYNVTSVDPYVSIPEQKDVSVTVPNANAEQKWYTASFEMPADGTFYLTLQAQQKIASTTITLKKNGARVDDAKIKITNGTIDIYTLKDEYTVGDTIEVAGTQVSTNKLYLYIEGVNVPFRPLIYENDFTNPSATIQQITVSGEEWKKKITFGDQRSTLYGAIPDAGTYTIFASEYEFTYPDLQRLGADLKKDVTRGVYGAAPVVLKTSQVAITNIPTVIPQGVSVEIEGTAKAVDSVIWYIFGTNYLSAGVESVNDDKFTISIDGAHTEDTAMAAGQYFLVVQSPMYDGLYSIAPAEMNTVLWNEDPKHADAILKSDKNGIYYSGIPLVAAPGYNTDATVIFSGDFRQTANAAQALCDALDSQNFDDMYAKVSFIVGAPTSIINPIPTKVTQGEIITLSGTTTGHVGDIVTIEFLSTAFAAVPKQAAGTAAFVTINTYVKEDGTWEAVFNTSSLNCDDYTVSVAVGSLGPSISKTTVIKGDAPVNPTVNPTAVPTVVPTATVPPKSPAPLFAVLAGLGAAAVLFMRRQ